MSSTDNKPDSFTPARLRNRHDGWTPDKQVAFIEALAATSCVREAAAAVGMSESSAYQLRRHRNAQAFRDAWEAALDVGLARLADRAMGRAMNGVPRPIFHQGEQVGEWRHFDERLTMFLLRARNPSRYGPWVGRERTVLPPDADDIILAMRLLQLEHQVAAEWAGETVEPLGRRARDDLDDDLHRPSRAEAEAISRAMERARSR